MRHTTLLPSLSLSPAWRTARLALTACLVALATLPAKAYYITTTVDYLGDNVWDVTIGIEDNTMDFSAFQLDIFLYGEGVIEQESLKCHDLMSDHTLLMSKPDGHYRFIAYSLSNTPLAQPTGELFTFTIKGSTDYISIGGALFATPEAVEVSGGALTEATDIAYVRPDGPRRPKTVTYDMMGRRVFKVGRGGIYIVDGKKVVNTK